MSRIVELVPISTTILRYKKASADMEKNIDDLEKPFKKTLGQLFLSSDKVHVFFSSLILVTNAINFYIVK